MTPEFRKFLQPYFNSADVDFEMITMWLITHSQTEIIETMDSIKNGLEMVESIEYTDLPNIFYYLGIASCYFQKQNKKQISTLTDIIQKAIANQAHKITTSLSSNDSVQLKLEQPMFEVNKKSLESQGYHVIVTNTSHTDYIVQKILVD